MSSNTAFMHVSRTMANASRIGTPELMRVPRVRMVRATMVFSINWPMIGTYKYTLSSNQLPVLLRRINFIVNQYASGNSGMTYQYFTVQRDTSMSNWGT